MSGLPPLVPVEGVFRHRVAIHEVGHAIVGNAVEIGDFDGLSISRQVNPRFAVQSGGEARFFTPALMVRNVQRLLDEICFCLGGVAAERVVFGSHGNGAGIGPTSDLAVATNVALQLETEFGMGTRLHHFSSEAWHAFGPPSSSWPMSRVEKILRQELARAEQIVAGSRAALLAVAKELEEAGSIAAPRFKELCAAVGNIAPAVGIKRGTRSSPPDQPDRGENAASDAQLEVRQ
ncbi:hypothetical protein AB4Z25_17940 [Rhizobium sp. RAF36]|uniref:hypothetical protein n=1 Tax=Rhizobium sp. RAF36 TaxID=3233055 RepID=UPI003F9504BA